MNVVGVIAEYNPFHNGHKYQLDKLKELTHSDYCVVVMSGNFVQRGEPALIDKYSRTKMALLNGADLVLELPVYYATSSAEHFATGAIALLDRLGIVDSICFGSECGDISLLSNFAQILADESDEFSEVLRQNLRKGLSYPLARNHALTSVHKELAAYIDIFSSPNNILGIEYMKALYRRNSAIIPFTNIRTGSGYHDTSLAKSMASATAIRHTLEQTDNLLLIANHVPSSVFQILEEQFRVSCPIYPQDISLSLKYKLLQYSQKGYTEFADVSPDLSDKIKKQLELFTTFPRFCDSLKTKDMTYTRISRCLLHILLDIKKDSLQNFIQDDFVYYARILGLKQGSTEILNAIKKNATIPLLPKLADAENILSNTPYPEHALELLNSDIFAAHVYDSVATNKFHTYFPNEYRRQIIKVR